MSLRLLHMLATALNAVHRGWTPHLLGLQVLRFRFLDSALTERAAHTLQMHVCRRVSTDAQQGAYLSSLERE